MAYDSVRGRIVMFAENTQETWEWDGGTWTKITPASGSPAARSGHALVYDLERKAVVMFGGLITGTPTNEAWTWNGNAWTDITATSAPPSARYNHGLAYDAGRKKVVLFGGYSGSTYLNETWEWGGSTWSNVTPGSGNPLPRQSHALAYDARRGRVILFGGTGATAAIGYLNDTWEWNGTAWTNVTSPTSNPSIRTYFAMAYDVSRGAIILFGGGVNSGQLDDTWELGSTGWTDLTRAGETPPARSNVGMAYDAARGQMIIFGGFNTSGTLADTWAFRYERAVAADERCISGVDGDGDTKIGCADPDCAGRCTPLCNPGLMTCDASWPHCGDAICQPIETKRLCPADCGAPTPVCGDFLCESPETAQTCAGDCP
jgi:hypothetical protein